MNLSGDAIKEIMDYYKIPIQNLIVVFDDVDTEIGCVKIRKKGGSGGHNGIKSIIQNLGTEEFARVKIGIGAPIFKEMMIGYVINKISDKEYNELCEGIKKGVESIPEVLKNGIDIAMNKYN